MTGGFNQHGSYAADMNARFAAIEAKYGPLDTPIGEGRG
jgi:hypothetical protein